MSSNELQRIVFGLGRTYQAAQKPLTIKALYESVTQVAGDRYSPADVKQAVKAVIERLTRQAQRLTEQSERLARQAGRRETLSNFFALRESDVPAVGAPEPTVQAVSATLKTFDASGREVANDNPEGKRHKATLHFPGLSLQEAEAAIPSNYYIHPNLQAAPHSETIRNEYSFEVDRTQVYPNYRAYESANGPGKLNGYAFGVAEKALRSAGKSSTAFRNRNGGWTYYDIPLEPYPYQPESGSEYLVRVGISDASEVDGRYDHYVRDVVRAFPSNSET